MLARNHESGIIKFHAAIHLCLDARGSTHVDGLADPALEIKMETPPSEVTQFSARLMMLVVEISLDASP